MPGRMLVELLLLLGLLEPPQAATATAAAKAAAVTAGVRSMAVFLLRPGLHRGNSKHRVADHTLRCRVIGHASRAGWPDCCSVARPTARSRPPEIAACIGTALSSQDLL